MSVLARHLKYPLTSEKSARSGVREEVRTSSGGVVDEKIVTSFVAKVFRGIGPQQIAHGTERRRLAKAIDLTNVVDCMNFRREATVDAQVLLVQHGSQRQAIERLHERVVKSDGIFDLAFRLWLYEG